MAKFEITGPDGKKYRVEGANAEGALSALKKMLGAPQQSPAPEPTPDAMTAGLSTLSGMTRNPSVKESTSGQDILAESAAAPAGLTEAQMAELGAPSRPSAPTVSREAIAAHYKPTVLGAIFDGIAQGATFGFADEIVGAVGGSTDIARAATDAGRRDRPKTQFAGEIAGALAVPLPGPKGVSTLKDAVKAGAKTGAAIGAAYGAGTSEGGILDRIEGGLEGAVTGGLFGAAAPLAVNFGTKAFRRVFKASAERPSIESLRAAKSVAYDAVDKSGERFGPDDLKALAEAASARMDDLNYLPEVDVNTAGLLKKLDILSTKDLTIGQVDKFRQAVWKRYNASKEEGLLEIIDSIDEMVASRTSTSELLDAARLANSRFKKAELLDLAFQKAKDQTASTGSGGNVLNKMKQAVTNIINNPKQAKWFSKAEIDTMRGFIEGTTTENVMRLVGKLSPSGNGLMTALNLGAVSANPAMLGVSALAAGSKAISDNAVERGAQRLIGMVGGGNALARPAPVRTAGRLNALAGPISGN